MNLDKPILKKIQATGRLRELSLYGVFGVLTTVVNICVYQLLLLVVDYRIGNLVAIFASKLFAYVTNKLFVFRSRCNSAGELVAEMLRFTVARGFTGLVDYFGLIVAVELLNCNRIHAKYALQLLVIVLNYVLGKRAVYLNGRSRGPETQKTEK